MGTARLFLPPDAVPGADCSVLVLNRTSQLSSYLVAPASFYQALPAPDVQGAFDCKQWATKQEGAFASVPECVLQQLQALQSAHLKLVQVFQLPYRLTATHTWHVGLSSHSAHSISNTDVNTTDENVAERRARNGTLSADLARIHALRSRFLQSRCSDALVRKAARLLANLMSVPQRTSAAQFWAPSAWQLVWLRIVQVQAALRTGTPSCSHEHMLDARRRLVAGVLSIACAFWLVFVPQQYTSMLPSASNIDQAVRIAHNTLTWCGAPCALVCITLVICRAYRGTNFINSEVHAAGSK